MLGLNGPPVCPSCARQRVVESGSNPPACSRIADPEGKHLEILRLQLATTVMERDQARDKIKRAANALKHHHMARPGIAAIVQLLTENSKDPRPELGDSF